MALLEINNLSRSFGGLKAVNDVSFAVEKGSIKAVIGPNGAGKTTLFNLIAGDLSFDCGSVLFGGVSLNGLQPFQVATLGMGRTFQNIKLFPGMTALENVMVGRHLCSRAGIVGSMGRFPAVRKEEREIRSHALDLLDLLGIGQFADINAESLAFGQQRAVEFARALAMDPGLLLLDEPAAGLNIYETAEVAGLISKIRDRGITILLVEHDMSLVMDISDEIVVLSFGEKIAEDIPREIQNNEEVIRVYLGEDDA